MWIEEMGIEVSCGLGWIPAVENFLEVIRAIEEYNGVTQTVHSIRAIDGDIQIDFALPVCDCEQAILSTIMSEWMSRICEVCGQEGSFEDDRVRCDKHKGKAVSLLSSVKSMDEPGIPVFKKGIYLAGKTHNGFWFAEYRFPERFFPPVDTGRLIDQTTTPADDFCNRKEGRAKVLAAKHQKDMHLVFLDIESYEQLYARDTIKEVIVGDYPTLSSLSFDLDDKDRITRREAYKRYLMGRAMTQLDTFSENEEGFVRRLVEEFDFKQRKHYLTGKTAFGLVPPNKFSQALDIRPSQPVVSGIDRISTWTLLADEGLYESPEDVKRSGAILPRSLVANHERALFDELYSCINDAGDTLEGFSVDDLEYIDIEQVEEWIEDAPIKSYKKKLMLRVLKDSDLLDQVQS